MADNEGGRGVGTLQMTQNDVLSHGVDLFEPTKQEKAVRSGREIMVRPTTSVRNEGPIEFLVPSQANDYMQLGSFRLWGVCRIYDAKSKERNQAVAKDVPYSVCNLFPAALFRAIEVCLNGEPVADLQTELHHYKQYIETVLSYGKDARAGHLPNSMFHMDEPGRFEQFGGNPSNLVRAELVGGSRDFDFEMPICSDFLQADRYLPYGNDLTIKFIRQNDAFSIFCDNDAVQLKVEIKDLRIYYRSLQMHPAVQQFHEKEWLEKGRPIIFPILRTVITPITINAGVRHHNQNTLFHGQLPNLLVIGFVNSDAYNGDYARNPFNFQHFGLSKINLRVKGVVVPSEPYRPDWDNGLFAREYNGLLQNTGIKISNDGCCITKAHFAGGCYLQAFDLTSDNCAGFHQHPPEDGSIQLELEFKDTLVKPIVMLAYAVFNAEVRINSKMRVSTHNLKRKATAALELEDD